MFENRWLLFLFTVFLLAFLPMCAAYAQSPANPLPNWAIGPFTRPDGVNPVIKPNPDSVFQCPMRGTSVHWEAAHTFNPAAVVRNGKIYVLYRAEDDSGASIGGYTSRLGLAVSDDGIHFTKFKEPVFYPADDQQKPNEWPGGCEDPRVVEAPDGTYVLAYTQWNRSRPRLGIATSRDLIHWTKQGPAFAKSKYEELSCKSASIVCAVSDGRLKAVKIKGKYWMLWGEDGTHAAISDNLIDWTPVDNASGELNIIMRPRAHYFDSMLTESGPPAILTDKGIVLIYNGKNTFGGDASAEVGEGAYSCGQALFDANDPTHFIGRLDTPFFKPELPFEKSGQYAAGTTFGEGLVLFHNKWFLYYGTADTFVAVAVADANRK